MKTSRTRHLEFFIGDVIALGIAYVLVMILYIKNAFFEYIGRFSRIGLSLLVMMVVANILTDAYRDVIRRSFVKELFEAVKQIVLALMLELVMLFLYKRTNYWDRRILCFTAVTGVCLVLLERQAVKRILQKRFKSTKHAKAVMVIATKDQAEIIIDKLLSQTVTVYKIKGLAVIGEDTEVGDRIHGIPVSCQDGDIYGFISSHIIDEVFVSILGQGEREVKLAKTLMSIGLVVHIYMEQYFQELSNYRSETLSGMSVMTCYTREIPRHQLFFKRVLDIMGGIVGSIMAIFIGIIIGPLIYIKSPGPIIFSQTRIGKNGRPFKFYKFRSMYMDAEKRKKELVEQNEGNVYMFKMENDPRIIPGIGHFIRKTSLDEFPQFFNVLKGDMSLVGTRPPTLDEYETYSFWHNKRLAIKPGLTGMWQAYGRSDIKDFDEVVKMDSEYIDGWTISTDIEIILKTILAVIKREGSR